MHWAIVLPLAASCCLLLPLAPPILPQCSPPCSLAAPSQATTYAPFPAQKTLIANPQVRDVYNIYIYIYPQFP